ncbi:MAG: CapK related-protein [Phycisphaerales bacterium]|nr:CapK related-protein [Phycisphaerales bacterium]
MFKPPAHRRAGCLRNSRLIGQFVHRHLLLPAFESGLKRRKTLRYWAELERTQWLSARELADRQLDALRGLLSHAFRNCPYYRSEWLRRGLDPAKVQSAADFSRWPVIDRETIRANRFEMRSRGAGLGLISKSTGGSSGVPLHFDLDHRSNDRRMASWHRGYAWAGAGPGTRQLYLWGAPLRARRPLKRCKDRLYDWLYRKRVFSSFDMSREREDAFVRELNATRPDAIVAYTNPLYELARSLIKRGVRVYSPKSIVVGAEKLHGFQREMIERAFGAPVFETYGSREFMLIGAECDRHTGLHLTQENMRVEVLDDDGWPTAPGAEGNVVITDLYNYGMPFIRYANGDRAIASGAGMCACGRGLALLKQVTGRRLDMLRTPDGRRIAGEFFPHLMKDFAAVARFQVVQERIDRVELRVVLMSPLGPAERRHLEGRVRDTLGPAIRFNLTEVTEIPLTAAGKLRVVISHVTDELHETKAGTLCAA